MVLDLWRFLLKLWTLNFILVFILIFFINNFWILYLRRRCFGRSFRILWWTNVLRCHLFYLIQNMIVLLFRNNVYAISDFLTFYLILIVFIRVFFKMSLVERIYLQIIIYLILYLVELLISEISLEFLVQKLLHVFIWSCIILINHFAAYWIIVILGLVTLTGILPYWKISWSRFICELFRRPLIVVLLKFSVLVLNFVFIYILMLFLFLNRQLLQVVKSN